MRASPYRGQYQAGYNVTHCPRRLDLRSEIGIPPLCATDLLLSSIPRLLHILSFLTTADHTIAAKTLAKKEQLTELWMVWARGCCAQLARASSERSHAPLQPPEPQPDMASRFSNQWICLLTFTQHFAGECIGAIEFIVVA